MLPKLIVVFVFYGVIYISLSYVVFSKIIFAEALTFFNETEKNKVIKIFTNFYDYLTEELIISHKKQLISPSYRCASLVIFGLPLCVIPLPACIIMTNSVPEYSLT